MWIGRPGYSGGPYNGGPLPIGSFWAERVYMFATHATNWLRAPRGSKNGHLRRYTPRQLGFCGRCT
ncbi:MAG TPA: hypothetical protein VEQ61_11610, partial [Thermoleophilaceae bacterium]|nr:hypothetical protein [Thermoleophilaceae bacterium]